MNAPAYQADGRPTSREAFYAIACDPQRSVVVEACAGAGKTWMLVSRILRALLEGARPHEILAITFTRKAAGEMRERLSDWLKMFASPHMTDEERAVELVLRGVAPHRAREMAPALAGLYEQVLKGGRSVEIRTFHAWFSQLLRAAPMDLLAELGLQPGMTLIEDLEDHRHEVFRRFHAALLRDDALRADHAALIARRGRSQAGKWLAAALDKRVELELADAAGTLDDSVPPPPDAAEFADPAQRLLVPLNRALMLRVALALGRQNKATPAKQGSLLEQAMAMPDASAAFEAACQALLTKQGSPRKGLDAPELNDALELLNLVRLSRDQQLAHEEHARMVRLSRVLLAEFAAYKRARGLADMADLERCALALLRDATLSGWVQERLDVQIRHVLIDEFQDTSPLQWHALHSWLSAYAGAGGGQGAPGVFIVGDPKQSIYRFRRAEPRVFAAAQAFVTEGLQGTWLACDHTRRNSPEVLSALNAVFASAVEQGDYSDFRTHTTEVPSARATEPGLRVLPGVLRLRGETKADDREALLWRDSLTTPRHEPEEVLREQEAAWVALAVHELVSAAQTRPGEVFVLCRKRASLRLVAQALQARHLPFAAVEDFALMDAPEVRDLVAVLDVLVSPSHRLSLAHALRSPVFGASDDDLIALFGPGQNDPWLALARGDHDERPALLRARQLLTAWHRAARRLPPHDLLDRIMAEGQVRERVAAVVPAERRLAALDAIDALLSQALLLDGGRYATPYNFVRALKRRAIKVAAPVQPDAVQLLTIHGAKGLEAKVVFVMDARPEASPADTATLLVDWPVEAEWPERCAFIYAESQCPPSLQPLLAQEREARRREELNGLYVAMSRAREQLVFSHTEPHRSAAGLSWWQRVEPLAQPWVPSAGEAGADVPTEIELKALPLWTPQPASAARVPREPKTEATEVSRLGQAVHRVLEWATGRSQPGGVDVAALAAAAAAEFTAPAAEVARSAARILHSPSCQRFFGGAALVWAGNEVPIADGDEPLRIDRLVALEETPGQRVWWVLDYKLAHQPQAQALYREQLQRYRALVQRLQPGESVRCALISGAGDVLEVH